MLHLLCEALRLFQTSDRQIVSYLICLQIYYLVRHPPLRERVRDLGQYMGVSFTV